jgi:hypothetical protein
VDIKNVYCKPIFAVYNGEAIIGEYQTAGSGHLFQAFFYLPRRGSFK